MAYFIGKRVHRVCCSSSEKSRKDRERERQEQYKQVRAHVNRDDGRMQAYGWSLPAKVQTPNTESPGARSQVPVPVPVYCRPLCEQEPSMQVGLGKTEPI